MGFSIAWVAVSGKPAELVHQELGLKPTGVFEEIPEAEVTGLVLPHGWYLVYANRSGHELFNEENLRRLSTTSALVACDVEEHVMVCKSFATMHGKVMWEVSHDAQKGPRHLEFAGELPKLFYNIKSKRETKQRDADEKGVHVDHIFDIPVTLAALYTGFRYDKVQPELGDRPFEVLTWKDESNQKPSFMNRLFGRK